MKALVYSKRERTFSMQEVDKPVPKKGEVLIRVVASSINAADYRTKKLGIGPRSGIYGGDVAGTVIQLGEGTTRFSIGDEVQGDLAMEDFGAFAEYVAAPEALLGKKPANVSFETAAATTLAGVTALQALRLSGNNLSGKRVLIIGASGGVGTFAVQLAKYLGAQVTGVTSAKNLAQTRAHGADRVLDYTAEDTLAQGERYDLILAIQGANSPRELCRALAHGGIAVIVGGALARVFQAMFFGWLYRGDEKRVRVLAARPNAEDTESLMQLVAQGKIKPVIDRVVALEDAGNAFLEVEKGHTSGKVVVRVQ